VQKMVDRTRIVDKGNGRLQRSHHLEGRRATLADVDRRWPIQRNYPEGRQSRAFYPSRTAMIPAKTRQTPATAFIAARDLICLVLS
jgi:hypothetical protein